MTQVSQVTRVTTSRSALATRLQAAGRGVRKVIVENARPSAIRHPLSAIRSALIRDIEPVLSSLAILIRQPDRSTALTTLANIRAIEAAVLRNENSDGPWLDYLTGEFIAGLEFVAEPRERSAARGKENPTWASNSITIDDTSRMSNALRNAAARGVMPTHLDTDGLRELDASLRAASFFSARTTGKGYVAELKKLVERHIKGEGIDNDLPQLRVEARELLQAYGYTPETGFPGDSRLGIPTAEPGSLRDLGSERRLNLIFNTQAALMRGLGQKIRGMDRIDLFPAWELIRITPKNAPRDWPNRWIEGGANLVDGRLIAPKDAEIWSVLGDSSVFGDALDVDHPPFAFESGMGWREVSFSEATALGMVIRPQDPGEAVNNAARDSAPRTPPADNFIGGQATLDSLEARLREIQRTNPLSMDSILAASRAANRP